MHSLSDPRGAEPGSSARDARRIDIVIPRDRILRWHLRLRDHLARLLPDADIFLKPEPRGGNWPEGVTTVLRLERSLSRSARGTLSEAVDPKTVAPAPAGKADVAIDLVGDVAASAQTRVLRPLYDGEASDAAAVTALMTDRAPALAVADVGARKRAAHGIASMEVVFDLTSGLEAVYSRMAALIQRALLAPESAELDAPRGLRSASATAFAARILANKCARAINRLCCHSPNWRIGWRFVDGPDVLDGAPLCDGGGWRIMQDRELNFFADPFPCDWRGSLGVFFERLEYSVGKGVIYYQPFDDNGPIGEAVRALEESWHLSYPFLIIHDDELYMVPEGSASNAVTLYRCVEFPGKWEPAAQLLEGVEAADSTIFQHEGRYWMTTVVREGVGGYSDILALYYADSLFGPWRPHAQYPALVQPRFARPAGAVVRRNGALLRPTQDCARDYGAALDIMRIDKLTPDEFEQALVARVTPGKGWPGRRLHTVNRVGRLECIDGAVLTPRNLALRKFAHGAIDRFGLLPSNPPRDKSPSAAG